VWPGPLRWPPEIVPTGSEGYGEFDGGQAAGDRGALAAKRGAPEDVFGNFGDGADLIVGAANGEPVTVLDALEAESGRLSGVTLHQMLALRKRRYMHGDFDDIRHVSWFLSPANRGAFH